MHIWSKTEYLITELAGLDVVDYQFQTSERFGIGKAEDTVTAVVCVSKDNGILKVDVKYKNTSSDEGFHPSNHIALSFDLLSDLSEDFLREKMPDIERVSQLLLDKNCNLIKKDQD